MTEEKSERSPKDESFNLERLSLAEKILAPVAIVIVVGWIVSWLERKEFDLFRSPFAALSFFGALVVAVFVTLKLFGKRPLPHKVDRVLLSIASMVPVIGFLVVQMLPLSNFMTVVGSIALAGVSISAYWRKHIPEVAAEPPAEVNPQASAAAPGGAAEK